MSEIDLVCAGLFQCKRDHLVSLPQSSTSVWDTSAQQLIQRKPSCRLVGLGEHRSVGDECQGHLGELLVDARDKAMVAAIEEVMVDARDELVVDPTDELVVDTLDEAMVESTGHAPEESCVCSVCE